MVLQEGANGVGHLVEGLLADDRAVVRVRPEGLVLGAEPLCQASAVGLRELAVEAGELRSTLAEVLGPINAANLRQAHRRMEAGSTIGKLALAGWGA